MKNHLILLYVIVLLFLYYYYNYQNKSIIHSNITSIDMFINDTIDITNCNKKIIKHIFKEDSNVFMLSNDCTFEDLFNQNFKHCCNLTIYVYENRISLDSIYNQNIQNKTLDYLPEFSHGFWSKNKNDISIELCFYNRALNSTISNDTHCFKIKYNVKTKKTLPTLFTSIRSLSEARLRIRK